MELLQIWRGMRTVALCPVSPRRIYVAIVVASLLISKVPSRDSRCLLPTSGSFQRAPTLLYDKDGARSVASGTPTPVGDISDCSWS
jgi:hypothetical protein